jgi:hypothetical protein
VAGALRQSDQAKRLERRLPGIVPAHARVVAGEHDVLQGGEGRDQVEVLEHEAHLAGPDPCSFAFAKGDHVAAVEVQLGPWAVVRVGGVEQAQDVHQRALARTRRAHDRDDLARLDADVHST